MSMDWALVFVLQVIFQPSLSAVFVTVEAEQAKYKSEFGGDVVMRCKFQPVPSDTLTGLRVTWHQIISKSLKRNVYQMDDGKEHLSFQDMDFQGRVKLNTEELQKGFAELQMSRLRINDSGTYQCLVHTGDGADYKLISLSVKAPYKAVTKRIQEAAEGDEVLLTCQSEGYPESTVVWQDGHLQNLNPNTTSVSTPDQLFIVTSQIHVRSSDKNNYTCNFINGHSATFHIPDDLPLHHVKNDALIVALSIGVILVVIIIVVFTYQRRKGSRTHSTRKLLVNGQGTSISAAACLQRRKGNEEEVTIFNEDCTVESLGAYLKAHYSDSSFSTEVGSHWDLPHKLQNNEGQPVTLQALIPEPKEMLFLEGPPGSENTTIAHILISSWAKGPTDALSNLLDLSMLRLLLYVDCSTVKADLFQEIMSQLSLEEKVSTENELRTVLTRSSNALLLLDGYREGNQFFDESLKRFLCEKGECRLLVMACPGQCPTLRATVGIGELLKLQIQTVKY